MQCKFSGCSGSVNIGYSKNILKLKLWGDREDQGMRNVVNLILWKCTAQPFWDLQAVPSLPSHSVSLNWTHRQLIFSLASINTCTQLWTKRDWCTREHRLSCLSSLWFGSLFAFREKNEWLRWVIFLSLKVQVISGHILKPQRLWTIHQEALASSDPVTPCIWNTENKLSSD